MSRFPPVTILARASIVLCAGLVALLVGELGARTLFSVRQIPVSRYQPSFVYAPQNDAQFDRRRFLSHPFLNYAPRPFDSRTLSVYRPDIRQTVTYDYTQNSLGFRTPDRSFAKPPDTKRIVTLGGSTTWDGPTDAQSWPSLLESKLNAHYRLSGTAVEVINLAVDGYSSPMSLVELAFLGLEFQPDLVISYDGVNDFMLLGYDGATPDYRTTIGRFDDRFLTLQSRLPIWSFKSYLVSVVSHVYDTRFSRGRPDVYGQVYVDKVSALPRSRDPLEGIEYFERNLRLMRAMSREYGARFAGSTAHWVAPTPAQAAQNARLRSFLEQERIDYVDLDALLPHDDWSIHVDQVHWTSKGLNLVAAQWAQKIVDGNLLDITQ